MTRRRHDAEPEPLQVVERARRKREFVLAAVARPRVDVAQGQRPADGPAEGDLAAKALQVAQEQEHQRSTQA